MLYISGCGLDILLIQPTVIITMHLLQYNFNTQLQHAITTMYIHTMM